METAITRALRGYFNSNGFSQEKIAEVLGVSQPAVTPYLTGRKTFGKNAASKWSTAFGFRPAFLITGEGSLFPEGDPRNGTRSVRNTGNNTNITTGDNSPIHVSGASEAEIMNQVLKAENRRLQNKVYELMAKLAQLGVPCDDGEDESCKM